MKQNYTTKIAILSALLMLTSGVSNTVLALGDGTPTIIFGKALVLRGLAKQGDTVKKSRFIPATTTVKLLRVLPLRNSKNNPFDDLLLPIAINNARKSSALIVITPTPAPTPSACPVNTVLTVVAVLPASMPLGQSLNLTTSSPYQLGVGSFNEAIKIAVINPGNATQATISMAPGFTYISGSSLGIVTEGSSLSYLVRRNSDSAEFEINFSFSVELVFDDMGISIQTLTGKLCKAGGSV